MDTMVGEHIEQPLITGSRTTIIIIIKDLYILTPTAFIQTRCTGRVMAGTVQELYGELHEKTL